MLFFTFLSAGIALLIAILGLLLFFGKGGGLLAGYNTMDPAKKALIDEKAFLRFNGKVMLILAAIIAVSALLNHLGQTWAWMLFIPGVFAIAIANIWSMRTKRFRLRDEDGNLIEASKPTEKQARERKIKLIAGIILAVLITIPVLWLVMEGSRDIRVDVGNTSLTIRGFYGETIDFDQISSVELLEEAMANLNPGGRRAGHGTTNNWRGSFGAGQLHIQYPQEGPTIRINRINGTAVFISLAEASQTRGLYNEIQNALLR